MTAYTFALILASPSIAFRRWLVLKEWDFRVGANLAEMRSERFWCFLLRTLYALTLEVSAFVNRWTALIFLWVARNGEHWTLWRALLASACLVALPWRTDGEYCGCELELAWWIPSDRVFSEREERPSSWMALWFDTGWIRYCVQREDCELGGYGS